jgi:hypothetical protein
MQPVFNGYGITQSVNVHLQDLAQLDALEATSSAHIHTLVSQIEQCQGDVDEVEAMVERMEQD